MWRRRSGWLAAGVGLVVAAIAVERLVALRARPPTDFDDAYMFLRYAGNLLAGHGLAWNPGQPVNGVTGLLHLAIVTAVRAAARSWSAAQVLAAASIGAGAVALAVLAVACARLARAPWLHRHPLRAAALLLPMVCYSDAFVFHATSGMDTMSSLFGNALLLVAVARLVEKPDRRAALLCALAGWLAILARPDNGVDALLVPFGAIALLVPPPRRRLALAFVVPFAALVGAQLALQRIFLGTALPLSFWVKRHFARPAFAGEWGWDPFLLLEVFFRASAPLWLVILLFARRRHARRLVVLLAPAALTCACLFGVNQVMGHLGRFYFPQVALVAAAAAVVADGEIDPAWQPIALRLGLVALAFFGGSAALEGAGRRYEARARTQVLADLGGYQVPAASPLPDRDSWQSSIEMAALAAAAPPGTRFAMSEHGLVAASAPNAIVDDVLGLHDRELALHGFSAAALLRREPDLIWMPHPDYTQILRDLLDSATFWADYDFYPDALTYGVALRRASPRFAALQALFEARFHADYPGLRLADYRARRAGRR